MPPRDYELTADEVEQAGRLLMPTFARIVQEKNDQQKQELLAAFDGKYLDHEARLKKLETILGKALWVFGIISTIVSATAGLLWSVIYDWCKKKFTSHP